MDFLISFIICFFICYFIITFLFIKVYLSGPDISFFICKTVWCGILISILIKLFPLSAIIFFVITNIFAETPLLLELCYHNYKFYNNLIHTHKSSILYWYTIFNLMLFTFEVILGIGAIIVYIFKLF